LNDDTDAIWKRIEVELAERVDAETRALWLDGLRPLSINHQRAVLAAPPTSRRWIEERFGAIIAAAAAAAVGGSVELQITDGTPPDAPNIEIGREFQRLANPKLTFEQFVIGDCNRLAHAAALTVAEQPGHAYNPLFICGPPGVGKSHLLSAIANLAKLHNPGIGVRITSGEAFTNDFLTALSSGSTEQFKARFRQVDILLLDDVQFLERKTKTEEEFFHTFNALHEAGRQVVLTSDRPPTDLRALEERLRQRFQAGLVADIAPPDYATRVTILHKLALSEKLELGSDAILPVIAARITDNVRDLEGALIRIVAYASLTLRPLTADLASEVLDGLYPSSMRRTSAPSLAEIQHAACTQFGITPQELVSSSRTRRVLWPRQVAMYLARELTTESLPAIGRSFGRDHTTVLNACRRAEQQIASDAQRGRAVEKLRASLAADAAPASNAARPRPLRESRAQ